MKPLKLMLGLVLVCFLSAGMIQAQNIAPGASLEGRWEVRNISVEDTLSVNERNIGVALAQYMFEESGVKGFEFLEGNTMVYLDERGDALGRARYDYTPVEASLEIDNNISDDGPYKVEIAQSDRIVLVNPDGLRLMLFRY